MEMTDEAAAIVIPAEHGGLPVTAIAESAFAYSRHTADILSVVIPDSVITIERNAFYSRSEITNVYISADSTITSIVFVGTEEEWNGIDKSGKCGITATET